MAAKGRPWPANPTPYNCFKLTKDSGHDLDDLKSRPANRIQLAAYGRNAH